MHLFDLFNRNLRHEAAASECPEDGEGVRITEQVNPTMIATSAPTQEDWYCSGESTARER